MLTLQMKFKSYIRSFLASDLWRFQGFADTEKGLLLISIVNS